MTRTTEVDLKWEMADLNRRIIAIEKSLAAVQAWQHKEMGALAVIAIIMTAFAKVVLKL